MVKFSVIYENDIGGRMDGKPAFVPTIVGKRCDTYDEAVMERERIIERRGYPQERVTIKEDV